MSKDTSNPEGKRGQARATFLEVINEATSKEKVRELVDQALSLNSLAYAHCGTCRARVQVEVPDVKKRIDALIALLEQGEGKPTGEGAAPVTIIVERVALSEDGAGTRSVWPPEPESDPSVAA